MIVMNVYIISAIFADENLRSVDFYPIGLQSFCDVIVGITTLWRNANELSFYAENGNIGNEYVKTRGLMASYFRYSTAIQPGNHLVGMLGYFIGKRFNIYSTGYCVLAIAIERFILVCHPFKVNTLLTKTKRKIVALLLTVFILGYSSMDFICRYFSFIYRASDVKENCYGNRFVDAIIESVVFFAIPAVATIALYSLIGRKLKTVQANQDRNRDLTRAFAVSCFLWVVTWIPLIIVDVIFDFYYQFRIGLLMYTKTFLESMDLCYDLALFCSVINPFLFIFITKDFQGPLKKVWDCLKSFHSMFSQQ